MTTPDRHRLPPLNGLRGFEAAARHSSFAKAADELALTSSAVSHQVRQLEAALGHRLFHRFARELVLTDAGRDFLETVRGALDLLKVGVARLAPYRMTGSLVVSCDAAFARFWLAPRLARFRQQRPDIEVWLDTSERLVDFDRQEVEVVVGRLRASGGEHLEVTLFDDCLGPCCKPELLPRRGAASLKDLPGATLLHDERRDNWLTWLKAAGSGDLDTADGPHFSDPGFALDAARSGRGIALVSDVLAIEELASGSLVAPFRHWIAIQDEYRLAYPRWLAEDAAVTALASFIRAEAVAQQVRLDALRAGAILVSSTAREAS